MPSLRLAPLLLAAALGACARGPAPAMPAPTYDVILRGGTVYDGSGAPPVVADVALRGDSIAAIGPLAGATARREIDVRGLAVAPGFVNMLSWAFDNLMADGRSESDIRQGVTLEIFGEGTSPGPVSDQMRATALARGDTITWRTLGEALDTLVARGTSPNVASFVGASQVRIHELGYENRAPTPAELDRMKDLVRAAMAEGALGLGTSLIYSPATFSTTEELVELARVAAAGGGTYISHMRSEGERLLEAADELIRIAREAGIPAEIYHIKASGRANWDKFDALVAKVDSARRAGLRITADMYLYPASSTGITTMLPDWALEGGHAGLMQRLRDPAERARVRAAMGTARDPSTVMFVNFRNPALRRYVGRRLGEVAAERGTDPLDTVLDLITEDDSRVGVVFFSMSEENVRKAVQLPWVSFGSDGGSYSGDPAGRANSTHPRAYGNFARLLGRYVREERLLTLEEAVRRLAALPAANLGLERRGRLLRGYFADVVVFDPATIRDNATFEAPHQYATGMVHVFVNGTQVLADGTHTGARPGRVVRGRGWQPRPAATP